MFLIFSKRIIDIIDGKFGSLVHKENNSFNGMIGMVQRKVEIDLLGAHEHCISIFDSRKQFLRWGL